MNQIQLLALFPTDEISQAGAFGIGNALLVSLIGICVVLLELALLAGCIILIGKIIKAFTKEKPKATEEIKTQAVEDSGVPTVGDRKVKLINVDEKSAAMVMALVSHETDIPLDRLDFKSIKKVD